ncbi:MAG: 4Fe-4S binding protein [Chloroflexota bacterium]|nr:4Fe-4S binding protein [Chloroflexota bacterium]
MISRLRSLVYLLPELWRTLFTRPITVRFPFAPLKLPPYFRGKVTIDDPHLCRGCGLCVRDCPAFALELERESDASNPSKRGEQFRLIHYHDRCAYCGQCEASCKAGAIRLVGEFVSAETDRDTLSQVMVEQEGGESAET